MKSEIRAIRNNVAAIGSQVENVGTGVIGVQRAGLDTVSSIALAILVIASGGLEAVAGKVDEATDMVI